MADDSIKNLEAIFTSMIKRVTATEIKNFVSEQTGNNKELLYQFILHFEEYSGLQIEERFRISIKSIAGLSTLNVHDATDSLLKYSARAEKLLASGDFLDAFYMASVFIKESSSFGNFGKNDFESVSARMLEVVGAITKSDAGIELKEKAFKALLNDGKNLSSNSAIIKFAWLNALYQAANDKDEVEEVLKVINELIGKNRNQVAETKDQGEEESLLLIKLGLYERIRTPQEVRHFLEANRHVKTFRVQLIENLVRQNLLPEAKQLIKEGKHVEESKGRFFVSPEWDQLMLGIAEKENDVKSIRNLALQLFLNSEYNFDYYQLLKKQYDPSRWKAQTERIIRQIREQPSFALHGIHAAAKILIEEENWSDLLRLLEKNSNLDFVDRYSDWLKEKFPEEILTVYRKAIRRFAEKFMGLEAYRTVVSTLDKMQSLRGGKEMVQALLIELKVTYRQRKSFVDELNKLVL